MLCGRGTDRNRDDGDLARYRIGGSGQSIETMITDPLFYAVAVPAVILMGLSKGGVAG